MRSWCSERTFSDNGYKDRQIHNVLNRRPNISKTDNKPSSVTILNRISRVLAPTQHKPVGLHHKEISSFLRPVKDSLGFRTPRVYRISCECGKVYTGQTGCSVDTRSKEHQRHIRLEHPDKSAIAEHCINSGHSMLFHDASIRATKTSYRDRIVREAIEIELHSNNMNRDVGFCVSKSWKPLVSSLKISP
jgi:hypothetical protein